MIVECPHCKTSNATGSEEGGSDTAAGSQVVCRACGRAFHAPQQVSHLATHTTQVGLAPEPDGLPADELSQPTQVAKPAHADATRVVRAVVADDEPTVQHDGPTDTGDLDLPASALPEPEHPPAEGPTGVMSVDLLDDRLRNMQHAEAPRPAPLQTVRVHLTTKWQMAKSWFLSQPPAVRIGLGVAAGVLLLLLVAVTWRGGDTAKVAFVSAAQPLLAEPAHGGAPPRVEGTLPRGSQVTVFDTVGAYVMVRDLQGRVGYVTPEALVSQRPNVSSDTPFVDCNAAPGENDAAACEARAEQQWDACGAWCDKSNPGGKCTDDCRGLYKSCLAACHGEAVRPDPAPSVPSLAVPPVENRPKATAHGAKAVPNKPRAPVPPGKKHRR